MLTYLPIYLLTPWSRVHLEKLTGFQLVKKFPTFYGTLRFITAVTSARHLSLSWASLIQSTLPHPTSWRSILILFSPLRLGLPSGSFLQVSPPKPCIRLSSPPYALHASPISFFSILSPEQYWVRIIKLLITHDYDIAPMISGNPAYTDSMLSAFKESLNELNCVLCPTSWTRKQKRCKTLWFEEPGTTFDVKNITDSNDPMVWFSTARGLDLSATFLCFSPKYFVGVETAI